MSFFTLLLIIHIAGGCTGLFSGTLSVIRKKGDRAHRVTGRIFFYSMLSTGSASLVLALMHPNYFLFIVGVFTIYMIATGQRSLQLKDLLKGQKPATIDYILTYTMLIIAVLFIVFGIYQLVNAKSFGAVFCGFGILSMRMVITDLKNYSGKSAIKNYWLTTHLQRMTGAYAAAATAFVVVNHFKGVPQVILWLLPTVLTLPLIIRWTKKYSKPSLPIKKLSVH